MVGRRRHSSSRGTLFHAVRVLSKQPTCCKNTELSLDQWFFTISPALFIIAQSVVFLLFAGLFFVLHNQTKRAHVANRNEKFDSVCVAWRATECGEWMHVRVTMLLMFSFDTAAPYAVVVHASPSHCFFSGTQLAGRLPLADLPCSATITPSHKRTSGMRPYRLHLQLSPAADAHFSHVAIAPRHERLFPPVSGFCECAAQRLTRTEVASLCGKGLASELKRGAALSSPPSTRHRFRRCRH